MVFAVVMLTCLVSSVLWTLLTRSPLTAWLSVTFGALWLPSNNRQLEGHNVVLLSPTHAITQGDMVGVIGWLFGMAFLLMWALRGERGHARSERVGLVMLVGLGVLALGALAAFETG